MDSFIAIREKARSLRAEIEADSEHLTGPQVVEKLLRREGYELLKLKADDALLHQAEAVLDREMAAVYLKEGGSREAETALIAHELGHLYLHEGPRSCSPDEVDVSSSVEGSASTTMEGYGARERHELQANVFGRELLLPGSLARHLFLKENWRASTIADQLGLPSDIVFQQLCDALLVPSTPEPKKPEKSEKPGLNKLQKEAAEHWGSPLLLEAGPGTGKTRTLVARIVNLVERGADPGSILALTFSNKAARELSERVAEELSPEAAAAIWTGTFHAFGLEIMRKYYQFFGLGPDVRMFSRSDAIELLEEMLPTLGLVYHQNLFEPALELKEMLSAMSRSKDELVDAAGYRALAQSMLEEATSDEEKETAERALEVAQVYAIYEKTLTEKRVVDFGDVIMKPTLLLEAQPAVCAAIRIRHRHILVDEYQDVNRASARLLRAISGDGDRLWVVGDSRQSIYRFRGASSANMALFCVDYPTATRKALGINYRSTSEIVANFSGFSKDMRASKAALSHEIHAHKGPSGINTDLCELPDPEGEFAAVAARVKSLQAQGVPYRDQAILCRSNKNLNLFAEALELRGIPALYFGSLFEREEVRDMLALLSMAAENLGGGLMRVAQFPAYQIPLNDVSVFLNLVRENNTTALTALSELDHYSEDISPEGVQGFRHLAQDLANLNRHKTPWTLLVDYLFEKSNYLRPILASETIPDRMRCLALYQFLNFVRGQMVQGRTVPAQRLLQKVRMLMLLGEERQLSQIPTPALGLDAVRIMTIHGSKGLEFEAVHLPTLVATSFPMSYRGNRCPPPKGLLTLVDADTETNPAAQLHDEEEECLFYVALSRAKKYLHLYRSRTSGERKRSASKFLARLVPAPIKVEVPEMLSLANIRQLSEQISLLEPPPEETQATMLSEYERCPKRYFYARVFGLAGSRKQSAFVKTHRCIYEVIDWVKNLPPGSSPSWDEVKEKLGASWQENGPTGHGFEEKYRALAEKLLGNLVSSQRGLVTAKVEPMAVQLTHGKVLVQPDQMVTNEDGQKILRIIKTGRKGSFVPEDTIHGLFQLGAQQTLGPGGSVEVVHLTDSKHTQVSMTERKCTTRVNKADQLLSQIKEGNFPADVDPVSCPRCPYLFVCPSVPKGTLCRRRDREDWPPGK